MLSTGAFFCALGRFCAPEHFLRPEAPGRWGGAMIFSPRLGALGRGDELFRPCLGRWGGAIRFSPRPGRWGGAMRFFAPRGGAVPCTGSAPQHCLAFNAICSELRFQGKIHYHPQMSIVQSICPINKIWLCIREQVLLTTDFRYNQLTNTYDPTFSLIIVPTYIKMV